MTNPRAVLKKMLVVQNYIRASGNATTREISADLKFSAKATRGYLRKLVESQKIIGFKSSRYHGEIYSQVPGAELIEISDSAYQIEMLERQKVRGEKMFHAVVDKPKPVAWKYPLRGTFESYLFGDANYQSDMSRILAAGYADCAGGA